MRLGSSTRPLPLPHLPLSAAASRPLSRPRRCPYAMSRRKDATGSAADVHVDTSQPPTGGQVHRTDLHRPAPWTAFADSLPPALRPVAVFVVGIGRAAVPLGRAGWSATKKMGSAGWTLVALFLPLLMWLGTKWLQWYIMSYVKKAQRVLSWAVWLLGLLPKNATGAAGGAAAGA